MSTFLAFVGGAAGWTFTEYVLHRFDGHGMKGNSTFSREHLTHHADPTYFAPSLVKLRMAVTVIGTLGVVLWLLAGPVGVFAAAGFTFGWLCYEWLHRRLHTHGPLNAYGRWARRHHFHHHFNDPRANHGVTSPFWDWAFGTLAEVDVVRVPRRHAPVWLVHQDELVPLHAADYVLRGRARRA